MTERLDSELAALVGQDHVSRAAVHDVWPLALMRQRRGVEEAPTQVVVRARTPHDVVEVVRLAARTGCRVVPVGAGTGVCGAISPTEHAIALDLRDLNRIVDIEVENLTCRVEAGVVGLRLEEELSRHGLTLGHFPSSLPVSTIGGLISTRSSGQQSSFHGNIEDLLLGLTVVRADGSVMTPRPGPRSAVGPALHQLFVGAEGALGVVVEAELRVHRVPELIVGAGYAFGSIDEALTAMRELVQRGIRPFVMRLYDAADTAFQGLDVEGMLLVVAVAGDEAVARAGAKVVERVLRAGRLLGEEPWRHWVQHRFDLSVERLREFLKPTGTYVDTVELATTWTRMPALYEAARHALSEADVVLCHFSHASEQGCCAYFTFGGAAPTDEDAVQRYDALWSRVMETALEARATISHHHGVGRLRAPWARREMGEWWRFWQDVRDSADPARLFNPDAVGGR